MPGAMKRPLCCVCVCVCGTREWAGAGRARALCRASAHLREAVQAESIAAQVEGGV